MTILLVIAILVFLIVIHELGHFIVAKILGVKVTEFGIFYPPRAFLFGRIGDTEYTLNWIPFGGFVRLYGDEGNKEHGKGAYIDASTVVRAAILVAGVAMNAIAAWALFTGAFALGVPHVLSANEPPSEGRLIITEVLPGSPADQVGLHSGDQITAVHDAIGARPTSLRPSTIVAFVGDHGGKPVTVNYMRGVASSSVTLIPAHAVVQQEAGRPALGIGLALVVNQSLPIGASMYQAYETTKHTFILVGQGLWGLISDAFRGHPDLTEVTGPVGLVGAVDEAAQNGWGDILSLAAFISVNLTIINLIPIPSLDGGRLLILIGEAITRRQAPRLTVQLLNLVGIALIVVLMVTVTYNDVTKLFF